MKRFLLTLTTLTILAVVTLHAGVNITKVDAIDPTDEVFIDMAVTAAMTSKSNGSLPCGAVVIYNGAWRSTGMPDAENTAEENAISRSRLPNLHNARVYTVNEPTVAARNAINAAGASAIFYVNPSEDVVAAGIYPASAYDESLLNTTFNQVPMLQIPYDDAAALLKSSAK